MYYQNYEDYMRSVLGYPIERENTYNNQYKTNFQFNENNTFFENADSNLTESDISDLYPEIYKILNPMVCKICDENKETISKDLITRMTDEIYNNFEENIGNTTVNVTVTADSRNENSSLNKDINSKVFSQNTINSKSNISKNNRNTENSKTNEKSTKEVKENRIEPRQRNFLLRDLIQILILQRLLRRRNPIHMPRPPMGGPGRPPMPRIYQDYYKF